MTKVGTNRNASIVDWLLRGATLVILLLLAWELGTLMRTSRSETWSHGHNKLRVLTTILPLYDFTREIGGNCIEVRNLLPPGVDPHEFSLTPGDVDKVANADIIIANGAGLDEFLADAVNKAGTQQKPIVYASDGLPILQRAEREEHSGHHHGSGDPHLWLDPVNARQYVLNISKAIVAELSRRGNSAATTEVEQRTSQYVADLTRLDEDYVAGLKSLRNRSFIAFHGAFQYLAKRYNLTIAAVWQSTPGREPAPNDVGAILEKARSKHIGALFAEPQFSPRAIEMIAADSSIPVYILDPFETAQELDQAHYVDTMRSNLATLIEALNRVR